MNEFREHFNRENNIASMPEPYLGKFFNACTEPCDMLQGPCACGAYHTQEEWPDNIQREVFGSIKQNEGKIILIRTPIGQIA